MFIYLDIETIPCQDPEVRQEITDSIQVPGNYSKPESIAKWEAENKPALVDEAWLKTAMDGAYGQIVCAAIAIDSQSPRCFYDDDWHNSEHNILDKLFDEISRIYRANRDMRPVFVGHNIVNFDLRFIYQRAVVNKLRPPSILPFDAKPWDDKVFDTMVKWSGVGRTVSLGKLCRTFKLPPKGSEIGEEIDGALVWKFVNAGRIVDVAKYCSGDVERVRALHQRMTFTIST